MSDVMKHFRKNELSGCLENDNCTEVLQKSNPNTNSGDKSSICYETSKDAFIHQKTPAGVEQNLSVICGKEIDTQQDRSLHMRTHSGTPKSDSKCDICNKVFPTAAGIRKHKKTHAHDRPYICDVCSKTYKNSSQLGVHKKRVHSGIKNHVCNICGYAATYKGTLREHLKRHIGDFNFHCESCGKGFYSKYELQRHKNFHTGERPFGCVICGKEFVSHGYLRRHKQDTHPEVQKDGSTVLFKGYKCEICGKVYKVMKSLRIHASCHTGENRLFLCDICGKALTSNVLLQAHKRIHTGEKPFVCDICGKNFTVKQGLQFHLRTHTGEKPYSCNQCDKSFTQKSSLIVHTRYHTGQRPYSCQLCKRGFVTKTLLKTHQKSQCI